ncbi:MAG: hypothetical protein CMH63_03035 [Nanoarchaeota archaeon]|nr:hypothetical protein [Nanoarchaeota archaeon]|tara:strand:+ start:27551 stop:28219 length:669 start_codon:yes stop_codon:yes gene_type:complete
MKYTLKDRDYFDSYRVLTDELNRKGFDYAVVGGSGIQATISDLFCKNQGTNIKDATGLEHLLRKTKDIDLTSTNSEYEFVEMFNELQALNPEISVDYINEKSRKLKINGTPVFINYQTGPADFRGLSDKFYNDCVGESEKLNLSYKNSKADVYVAKPEFLVASKLTRNDPKDIWDITSLLRTVENYSTEKFDRNKLKGYLEESGKGSYFGRFVEIEKQILEE